MSLAMVSQQPAEPTSITEAPSVELQPAPFWKRFLAYCIDLGIISAITYAILLVMLAAAAGSVAAAGLAEKVANLDRGTAILAIAVVLMILFAILALYHGYFIYFELKSGQTPGKKLFGLKVVSTQGERITLNQAIMRDMFRYVDCMLFFPGLISVLVTERNQRLGDLFCATRVIYSKSREERQKYLYVTQENFVSLREVLNPQPVPNEVRRQFLNVVYPIYILGRKPSHPEDLIPWEELARGYLPGAATIPGGLDQTTTLLFFAEHCFQSHNEDQGS